MEKTIEIKNKNNQPLINASVFVIEKETEEMSSFSFSNDQGLAILNIDENKNFFLVIQPEENNILGVCINIEREG